MENPLDTFETVLEKYVFSIASAVIDQLGSAHQDKLVNLLMNCNKSQITSHALAEVENQKANKHSRKAGNQSVENKLRGQWQAAMSLPGSGYVAYQQRQLIIYQTHIDLMLHHISRLEKLLEQAVGKEVVQPRALIRLTQYQTLLDQYILKVAKSRADQQKVSIQLNLYYESIALETSQ